MIKYRTTKYDNEIKKIEIERETEKQVVLRPDTWNPKGRRENKISEYDNWHDTFEEAREFLLQREYRKRDDALRDQAKAEKNIVNINGLKEE